LNSRNFADIAFVELTRQRFLNHGVLDFQLDFGFTSPPWDVLRNIDISLDCFPHNSGTTLCESLYLGVPFVTLLGAPPTGTLGTAVLDSVGLNELSAKDLNQYIHIAVSLANNIDHLSQLRTTLRQRMRSSPLMDELGFSKRVANAYRQMWIEWCDNELLISNPSDTISGEFSNNAMDSLKFFIEEMKSDYSMGNFSKVVDIYSSISHIGTSLHMSNMVAASAMNLGNNALAEKVWKIADILFPGNPEINSNLSVLFLKENRLDEALLYANNAISLIKGNPRLHYNLACVHERLLSFDNAILEYSTAISLDEHYIDAYINMANILKIKKNYSSAEKLYRKVLEIDSCNLLALNNLGALFVESSSICNAIDILRTACQMYPDSIDTKINLACNLINAGMHDDGICIYDEVLKADPTHRIAWSNYLFALNYAPNLSPGDRIEKYKEYDKLFASPFREQWITHENIKDKDRRLRIGYVYSQFNRHSSRNFLMPLLENHDRDQFDLYAYSDVAHEDEVTVLYKNLFDIWIVCSGQSDEWLYQRIKQDEIDILIDLAGHTGGNRLLVFARKPAPVSLHWLDYGHSTGLSAIDYYLTDMVASPLGAEEFFAEKPWRLDAISAAYRPNHDMGEVNPLPALTRGYVTFGTLTRAVRLNDSVIETWSKILCLVPQSRLILNSRSFSDTAYVEMTRQRFLIHGVLDFQLDFGFTSPPWDVLRNIDITLDCFPHNSGTTLCESLYLGVPFVTLVDAPPTGTLGTAVLDSVGLNELSAKDLNQYIHIAVSLANNIDHLSQLRTTLRQRMKSSPLMDELGFSNRVANAYRQMWKNWCS
jgi:predicted O-linked N-acetylglucosamine transferase (SPINDLY family)